MIGRILVVDDEPGIRKSLAVMLRRESYNVTETASVADAVGQLKTRPFELVIADLRMEPLNGLDLLVLLRRYRPECPAIIITAFGTADVRDEARRLGAVDFLDKPLHGPDVLSRIRDILGAGGAGDPS